MEVSAFRYSAGIGLHGRSPLLRLQSDERLIALMRRGNHAAYEVLVSRYHSRLLAFCRHLLGSKEDAEDVLQEVLAAAFNAILADERAINVRPWLYRIARNRSLNHLRRIQAIGVDSMDIHYSEYGATTADKVHDRERFRLLVDDIHGLPETQRTALVLREMDALSYEQIAEAMDTTVPGVKSLLVRARISLAEAAEARQLSCAEVRIELAEVAEGLQKRPTPLVRRHLRGCRRCASFQGQLKQTNKALAALLPIGPLALLRQLLVAHIGHSAGTGSGATAAGATAASATGATGAGAGAAGAGGMAAAAGTAGGTAAFTSVGGLISAGAGAVATKAAAGLAAAALVTAGAVEATHVTTHRHLAATPPAASHVSGGSSVLPAPAIGVVHDVAAPVHKRDHHHAVTKTKKTPEKTGVTAASTTTATASLTDKQKLALDKTKPSKPGRTSTQTDATVLSTPSAQPAPDSGATDTGSSTGSQTTSSSTGTTGPTGPTGPASGGTGLPSGSTSGDTTTTTTSSSTATTTTPTTTTPAPAPGP
ncbi:MAG TPA: RNA polymerase sigma factor [Solirubrobacteraceae bacterium]|nr:RNA polymerase sigma factor [Solirubrobacteraceae bacterium]